MLLNNVLSHISEDHAVDVRTEQPDATASRLVALLLLLQYKPDVEPDVLGRNLASGRRDAIYPVLTWLLRRFQDLKKRAYVAKFVAPLPIPAEILQDKSVAEADAALKAMQAAFVDLHRQVESARASGFSPADIKLEIGEMERDREQLAAKIARVKRKVQGLPNLAHQLEVVSALRREQEEELALADRYNDQRHMLQRLESEYARRVDTLQRMQASRAPGTPERHLVQLMEELSMNRYLVQETLPHDLDECHARASDLTRVLGAALTDDDVAASEQQCRALQAEVTALTQERASSNNPLGDTLAMYRQQAKVAQHKKEAVASRLNEVMEEKSRVERELQARRDEAEASGRRVLHGEEWTRYKASVREKTQQYRDLKIAKDSMDVELGVLTRTEQILAQQWAVLKAKLDALEAERGIAGYSETEGRLEDVTAKRDAVNSAKAATLEEITALVAQINEEIAKRSAQLEPAVRVLQGLKERKKEIETQWSARKMAYDSVAAGLESNRSQLEHDVSEAAADCASLEREYHLLQQRLKLLELQHRRIFAEEAAYQGGPSVTRGFASYKEMYNKQLNEMMSATKSLQKQKKRVKESHEPNMAQIALIGNLFTLLQAKTSSVQAALDEARARDSKQQARPVVAPARSGQGSNMLVIE